MGVRMHKTLLAVLFIFFSIPSGAFAQPEYPLVEVLGGYSYLRANPEGFNLHGWNASVAGNITDWFGVEGDLSGHYGHPSDRFGSIPGIDIDQYTFMGGPRLAYRTGPVVPFAHFLIGAVRASTRDVEFGSTSDWALGTVVGGGLDVGISKSVAVRVAQVDWLMTRFNTGHHDAERQNNFRFSAGIVLKFGPR
jgi:hypothetical protein